jgi:site-specific recombinase XerD
MRHTHATHALLRGVELATVRDNLRHAALATTSIYLHTDEARRARGLSKAFAKPWLRYLHQLCINCIN